MATVVETVIFFMNEISINSVLIAWKPCQCFKILFIHDVFVLNHLSADPDVIFDFDPAEGDTVELAFESERKLPFQQKDFSINRKGVVTIKVGADKQDLVKLNRTDLQLKLDTRKGRYFLRFSKKF